MLTPRFRAVAVLLVPLLALVGPACARRIRTPPPPEAFNGAYFRFPTGLQLAVYEDPTAARTSVTVSYGSGSHLDPAGQEGTAHLVEHLAGRGRVGERRSIDARLFALGSLDNAFTSADETQYVADVPPAALASLLELEAERMREPLANITEAEFLAERGVVETEGHQRDEQDDSTESLIHIALKTLFADHPYGRPIGGSESSLRRIELAHARQWARTHYTPDNAVIVIHGPVQPATAKALVEQAFGGLATGDAAHPASPPTSNTPPDLPPALAKAPPLRTVVAPVSTRELWLVWAAPGRLSDEAVRVHGAVVALDFALERYFRDDERVESILTAPLILDGMSVVAARLELPAHVDVLSLHGELMEKFEVGENHLWSAELADDVAETLSAVAFSELENGFGATAAKHVRSNRRSDFAAAWRDQILTGATSQLFTDARKYFRRDQVRSLLFVPAAVGRAFREAPPVKLTARDEGDLSERLLPEGASARQIMSALPPIETFDLDNGMRIVVVRRSRLPTVEARLFLRTRPTASAGVPEMPMMAMLQSGGSWSYSVSGKYALDGYAVYERRCRPDALDYELSRMGDWVKNSRIYPKLHDYLKVRIAKALDKLPQTPAPRVENFSREHLFGVKSRPFSYAANSLRGLGANEVQRWLDFELRPHNATLILVGDLPDAERIKAMVFWNFLGWSNDRGGYPAPPSVTVPFKEPRPAPTAAKALLYTRRAALAQIKVAVRAPRIPPSKLPAWVLLSSVIEDRLRSELREQQGIAYGVHASLDDAPTGAMIEIDTSVRPEHAAAVIGFVREVLRRAATEPLSAGEVERARWDVARAFDSGFATVEDVADRLQGAAIRDASPQLWAEYQEALASIDAQAISGAARELSVGAEAITVTGNTTNVEAALRAAGLEVEVVK